MRNVTSTYQESVSGGGRGSPSAPTFGRVRITQTSSSERTTESVPDGAAWAHQASFTPSSANQANFASSSAHQGSFTPSPAKGSRINKETYYDRRYSVSTTGGGISGGGGGYISGDQLNGDVSKSYHRRSPLTHTKQDYHRRYSVSTDGNYQRDYTYNGMGDLDFEAEEYLSREPRPYKSSVRKVVRQTSNHFSSGGDAPYISPYSKGSLGISQGDFGGRTSPKIFVHRRAPGLRAGSLSRIETLESLRENRGSYPRAMSLSRGSGVRRVASDLVDVEFGSQPLDLGHEDDSYEIRRQLRIARNRARASSASRLDPRVRAGSVPSGDVRIIYPPRYPVTSITGGSPVYNNSTAEIHIVQSMGSRSPRRRRAASVSRVSYTGGVPRVVESPLAGVTSSRRQYRSSSISSRVGGSTYQSPYIATGYTASSSSPSPSYVPSSPGYSRMTSSTSETHTRVRDPTLYGVGPENDEDLTRYVLEPGEKFLPTDVSVSMLPSGQKAVTYTRFRQTGSGDHRQANIEIERIIEKTKKLQDSLNTLEDFVRRNRSLFPEDIIIYQKIIFYLLGEDELRAHGYPPDAEVYGVKIREKLVAPYGSDVASILKRYYKRYTEVDVIYEEREAIKRRLREAELESKEEQEEEERRRKRRIRVDTEIIEEEEEWLRRRREAAKKRKHLDETLYVDEEELIPRLRHSPRRPRDFDDGAEPPQFSAKPKPRTVCTGDTVKFSCAVFGHPEPTIEWFHNNKPLFNTSRHTIDDRYIGSSSLCIRNIQKEDAGSYTARAVNMHGEVSATAALYIEEDELTRRKEALRRPWFIHEVHNTTTQVGQMVVLEAQATGKPLPTFRWQRNNMDILDDVDHIRVVSDGAGGTKLIIRDVRPGDAGLYVCVAENTAGRTACSATLRVGESFDLTEYYTLPKFGEMPDFPHTHPHTPSMPHSAPYPVPQAGPMPKSRLPQLPFELDDIIMKNWNNPAGFYLDFDGEEPAEGRKPRFVKVPSTHITVQEGDPLTLRCTVDGQPKPIVKWYKGVRELTYTGRHRVLAEGNDTHMMQIRMTMLTDPGEYTIVALNRCGMVKYTVFVNVVPKSPEEVEANRKRPEHAMQEYDLIKKTAQGKMAPVFIKRLPREKQILVGGTLKLECHVGEAKMKEYVVGYEVVAKDSDTGKQRPATSSSSSSSSNVLPQNGYTQSSEPVSVQPSTQQVPNVPVTQVQVQPEPVTPTHIPEVPATSTAEIPVQIVPTTEQVPSSTTQEQEINISKEHQIPEIASEEGKEKKSKKRSKKSDKSASPEAPSEVPTVIESTPAASPADPVSPAVPEVSFESSDEEAMQAEIKNVEHSEPVKAESVEQAALAETVSSETPAEVVPIAITPESVEPEAKETAGIPVRLQTMLESCVAPLGSDASFTCSVSGTPPIKVEWLKSDQPLSSTDNITIDTNISSDGNGSCRLSISRLSTQDEGSYTIKVSNDFGLGSSTASLSVIDKVVPQINVTFDDDENEDDDEELSELSAAEND